MKGLRDTRPVIVWFRRDFRLADNPALHAAMAHGGPLLPVYVHDPGEEGAWCPGAASRWWLRVALERFDARLRSLGVRFILRKGDSVSALLELARESKAKTVFWNRLYEPTLIGRDKRLVEVLESQGIEARSFPGTLMLEPEAVRTKTGTHYQVFTPFWQQAKRLVVSTAPLPGPEYIPAPRSWPSSLSLGDLGLTQAGKWEDKLSKYWIPDEPAAQTALDGFVRDAMGGYAVGRDRMGEPGTSRISPYLHWGHISPNQVMCAVERAVAGGAGEMGAEAWLRQLFWREFAHHLLAAVPDLPDSPLRKSFGRFPWSFREDWLLAWREGRTGYPVVDAAMRELWETGWMHNRARMIVGSFLVKDLLLDWREGERWFWDTLVDANLANNSFGWQWIAGCGADAAPYFRIFNPVGQGERFDPVGTYVRRWMPELAKLPDAWIHKPWMTPPSILKEAGLGRVTLPVVDHSEARTLALQAYYLTNSK